jgi:hypothetical protein
LALSGYANRAGATVVFSGDANGLSASTSFSLSGTQLTILLTNTDTAGVDNYTDVLSSLFFNLGTSSFAPVPATVNTRQTIDPAVLPTGSIIQTSTCDVQSCSGKTNIGGEWAYAFGGSSGLSQIPNQGIGSAGYLNSPSNSAGSFNGQKYESASRLSGIESGLLPTAWSAWSGNNYLDSNALVEGTVKFVLNVGSGLQESDIKNVYFTYGK